MNGAEKERQSLTVEILVAEGNTRYFKITEIWEKDTEYSVTFSKIETVELKESEFLKDSKPTELFYFQNGENEVRHRIMRNDGVPMNVLYPKE